MGGVVVADLLVAEEQHAAAPVLVVLIERVRPARVLAGALVVLERIARAELPQDMHLKLGVALQPTLKRLHEMGLRHVQPRSRARGQGTTTAARAATIDA